MSERNRFAPLLAKGVLVGLTGLMFGLGFTNSIAGVPLVMAAMILTAALFVCAGLFWFGGRKHEACYCLAAWALIAALISAVA